MWWVNRLNQIEKGVQVKICAPFFVCRFDSAQRPGDLTGQQSKFNISDLTD